MTTTEQPATPGYLIEEKKKLSESMLWNLQRQFYDSRGLSAWESGTVPSYVTSNPYIANCYAEVLLAYLKDGVSAPAGHHEKSHGKGDKGDKKRVIDPSKPIYIVELAAGHGRFSFLFLKKFTALLKASSLRDLKIRYVMTDFTDNNIKSWQAQPLFKQFIDAGILDFGKFDVESDPTIRLVSTGQPLTSSDVHNPMVVFGNYIFDTLTQDLFRFEGGQVHEVLVTLRHSQPTAPDLTNPEVMSQFALTYDQRAIDPSNYYAEPFLNRLLMQYRDRLSDTTIALPSGGLRGIFHLLEVSSNRMLLLSSDKGYTHEDELFFLTTQHIQFHGSLSMMVNYHAFSLALGDPQLGGFSAATAQRHINLKTAGFIVGGQEAAFRDTLVTFNEVMDVFGPYDFYTLSAQVRQHTQTPSIEQILGLMRMSRFDPNVIHEYSKELLENAGNVSDTMKHELYAAMMRCWDNFYPLGRDLPFEMARILLAMRKPREAVQFNQYSLQLFGNHPVTYGNMGICHYHAEQPEEALRCFDKSLELSPNYGLPKAWKARVLAESNR